MIGSSNLPAPDRSNYGLGTAYITLGGSSASGVLLYDGRSLLTAAHLFAGVSNGAQATVQFSDTQQWVASYTSADWAVHPDYVDGAVNHDLAIIQLNNVATQIPRFDLYRHSPIGQDFTTVGYGRVGTGLTGSSADNPDPVPRSVQNTADMDGDAFKNAIGPAVGFYPQRGTQFIADFDDGSAQVDALGQLADTVHLGLGSSEGMIAAGDSGGPAFIAGRLAGIASYIASIETQDAAPDVDNTSNSSFGEVGAWQRIDAYQQWIDQQIRQGYSTEAIAASQVVEGDGGAVYAYFTVTFHGTRAYPDQWLSVDYTTRDGTALQNHDYVSQSGTLVLYPNETAAHIEIQILGDSTPEQDEYFYLDVTNPVGGAFQGDAVVLTAQRLILDDDNVIS